MFQRISVLFALALPFACRGDDKGDDTASGTGSGDEGGGDDTAVGSGGDEGGDEGGDDGPDPSGLIPLTDADNYTYQGTLDAPSTAVKELTDISISWSSLSTDLQCHDLDPVADIDNTVLLVFPYLTQEEVEQGLSTDSLEQSDLGVYLSQEPGDETAVTLANFTFFGTDADIEAEFTEGSGTWLVLFASGTTVGVGSRMLTFIEPRADTENTEVEVTDGCSVLDYTVDIAGASSVQVLADGPWTVDWSAITETGQGTEFLDTKVSSIMVSWYPGLTAADLEGQFLDLELIAGQTWTADHKSGTSADLSLATSTEDGSAFPGFTETDGTWVFALRCQTCPNPAPLLLTVLEPVSG